MSWVCAFDLETIPCTESVGRLHGVANCDDDKAAELLGSKFPKLPLHSIACIGALLAERVEDHWQVRSLGAPHIGDRTEAELISAFAERLHALRPTLVSFNGHGFDLPVLRYRAMVNAIAAPGLSARPYYRRYDDSAVDLCDLLSSFDGRGKMGLDDLCKVLGLPGKPEGIDGSKVWEAVKEGRIADVSRYCESDIINTYRVWLRHELFRGALSKASYETSEADLMAYITARLEDRPHLRFMVEHLSVDTSSDASASRDQAPRSDGINVQSE